MRAGRDREPERRDPKVLLMINTKSVEKSSTLDYATPHQHGRSAMSTARLAVALTGVALPYLARIPGMFVHGPDWLTSYFGSGPDAILFFSAINAINWGAVVVGTLAYRTVPAIVVAALTGFAWPVYGHATLDLASDAQAAIGLLVIPLHSLPLVGLGWVLGFAVDDWTWSRRRRQNGKGIAP